MATNNSGSTASNPTDQVTQTMAAVAGVLKTAGENAAEGNRELAQCVMRQAEQNAKQLLQTLQTMAASRDPAAVTKLYADFVTMSAQTHAKQLLEVGQLMAQSSRQSWGPIAEAIMSASTKTTQPG